jgi:thyrotropin receptor
MLNDKYKKECKDKGYLQPSEALKVNGSLNKNVTIGTRDTGTLTRWFRSLDYNNLTMATDQDDEMDFDNSFENGFFHPPATVKNDYLEAICGNLLTTSSKKKVICYPMPDALNPCEDVMGSNWLRGSVWIVVSLTVIGNICVLVVLFSNRSELTVPKFLMCNLALADFSMGMYLLFIASIDLHSMGEYFNFAFDWQYGEIFSNTLNPLSY